MWRHFSFYFTFKNILMIMVIIETWSFLWSNTNKVCFITKITDKTGNIRAALRRDWNRLCGSGAQVWSVSDGRTTASSRLEWACRRTNTLFQFVWTHRTEVQSPHGDSLTVLTEITQDEITLTKWSINRHSWMRSVKCVCLCLQERRRASAD